MFRYSKWFRCSKWGLLHHGESAGARCHLCTAVVLLACLQCGRGLCEGGPKGGGIERLPSPNRIKTCQDHLVQVLAGLQSIWDERSRHGRRCNKQVKNTDCYHVVRSTLNPYAPECSGHPPQSGNFRSRRVLARAACRPANQQRWR